MNEPRLFPLILAGGSGTRFWPLSREARPKQLLPLAGKRPLIADTFERLRGLAPPRDVSVVCGAAHARAVRRALPRLLPANVMVEPAARNTAPCIGWAALRVRERDPKGVLIVLPSDHHVADAPGFREVLRRCASVAAEGPFCTVGIRPTHPETGYGYLRLGAELAPGVRGVAAFVEKPDLARAQAYVAGGDHLWNGGIFAFRVDVLLREIERQLPKLWAVLRRLAPAIGTSREGAAVRRHFPKAPSISIDYGVMEKAERVAVVPADVGWSDLGSFDALSGVRPLDAQGNVGAPDALLIDSRNCVVVGSGRPVAVVGMENVVVVDAGDALLVVPRDRCQDVRQVVLELRRRKATRYL
ncbi:MAG: mannose-1-phosphate guanylyltransferase [Deltaproteobacteria bacterium]